LPAQVGGEITSNDANLKSTNRFSAQLVDGLGGGDGAALLVRVVLQVQIGGGTNWLH
jgi:hypothetical protein